MPKKLLRFLTADATIVISNLYLIKYQNLEKRPTIVHIIRFANKNMLC